MSIFFLLLFPLQEWLINEKQLHVFGMKLPTGFQLIGQVVCTFALFHQWYGRFVLPAMPGANSQGFQSKARDDSLRKYLKKFSILNFVLCTVVC